MSRVIVGLQKQFLNIHKNKLDKVIWLNQLFKSVWMINLLKRKILIKSRDYLKLKAPQS